MVNPISLARLRNAELLALCSDILDLGKRFDLVAITVNTHFDMFENAQKPMRDQYAVEKGNPLSQSLEAADFRRDEAIIGLRGLAESYARHFVAAKVEAQVHSCGPSGRSAGASRSATAESIDSPEELTSCSTVSATMPRFRRPYG